MIDRTEGMEYNISSTQCEERWSSHFCSKLFVGGKSELSYNQYYYGYYYSFTFSLSSCSSIHR